MKGAGRYGVCAPLSVRGLYPHIITDNPGLGLIERAKTYIKSNGGSEHYLEFFHDMQKSMCTKNGTTQEIRKPELKDIRDALNADRVMMALVSTIIFEEEDEDIPHWIVITGEDNGISQSTIQLMNINQKHTGQFTSKTCIQMQRDIKRLL